MLGISVFELKQKKNCSVSTEGGRKGREGEGTHRTLETQLNVYVRFVTVI